MHRKCNMEAEKSALKSEDVAENSLQLQTNKGVKRKAEFQMIHCSVCKISLNSSSQASAHFAGKSHQSKTRSQSSEPKKQEPKPPTVPTLTENFSCDLCQRKFNSSSQLKAHLSGKAHQMFSQSKLATSAFIPAAKTATESTTVQNTEGTTPTNDVSVMVGSNLGKLFHCPVCNITLNSQKQLDQHNKGLRHKIVIGKAKPPQVTGEKWENVRYMKIANAVLGINKDTVTGSGGGMNLKQFYCEKCNITVNSQTQLDQHLLSQKHKLKGTQPKDVQTKKTRGSTSFRGGRGIGRGYSRNNVNNVKQPHFGKQYSERGKLLRPLSVNFVRGSTSLIQPYHGGFDNWNSNFALDTLRPSSNIAMF